MGKAQSRVDVPRVRGKTMIGCEQMCQALNDNAQEIAELRAKLTEQAERADRLASLLCDLSTERDDPDTDPEHAAQWIGNELERLMLRNLQAIQNETVAAERAEQAQAEVERLRGTLAADKSIKQALRHYVEILEKRVILACLVVRAAQKVDKTPMPYMTVLNALHNALDDFEEAASHQHTEMPEPRHEWETNYRDYWHPGSIQRENSDLRKALKVKTRHADLCETRIKELEGQRASLLNACKAALDDILDEEGPDAHHYPVPLLKAAISQAEEAHDAVG